jgi:hypothetical protein
VVEIKDDLGIKAGDKKAMIARLKAQGVNAADISLFDGADNSTPALKANPKNILSRFQNSGGNIDKTQQRANQSSNGTSAARSLSAVVSGISPEAAAIAARGASHPNPSPEKSTAKRSSATVADLSVKGLINPGLGLIISKLKTELKARGAGTGFIGLQRKFRIMDDDGDGALSLGEFKKAMNEMNMNLQENELRMLFAQFDQDNSGKISFEEFVQGVR